jgi:anti-sigma B factor antagonist
MSEQEAVSIESRSEVILARVAGDRMGEENVQEVQSALVAAASQLPGVPVALDLSAVSFLSSAGIGVLVALVRKFKQDGRRFMLIGLQGPVRETLTVCRLIKLFEVHESVDAAMAQTRKPSL